VRSPETRVITTPSGARRLIVDLDERDLARYASVVANVARHVERSLGDGVLAHRTGPRGPAPIAPGWARWRRCLAAATHHPDLVVLRSDVRRCYRSIGPDAVAAGLRRAGAGAAARSDVDETLARFRAAGIDGLPIGPAPSAIVANAVLAVADDAIRAEGVLHLRWVDDVALVGDHRAVARAFRAWRAAIVDLGLRVHDDKTSIVRAGHTPASVGPSLARPGLVP